MYERAYPILIGFLLSAISINWQKAGKFVLEGPCRYTIDVGKNHDIVFAHIFGNYLTIKIYKMYTYEIGIHVCIRLDIFIERERDTYVCVHSCIRSKTRDGCRFIIEIIGRIDVNTLIGFIS